MKVERAAWQRLNVPIWDIFINIIFDNSRLHNSVPFLEGAFWLRGCNLSTLDDSGTSIAKGYNRYQSNFP